MVLWPTVISGVSASVRMPLTGRTKQIDIVKAIDAKMLFPIHTEHAEMYVRLTRNVMVVEEGKSYSLKTINHIH